MHPKARIMTLRQDYAQALRAITNHKTYHGSSRLHPLHDHCLHFLKRDKRPITGCTHVLRKKRVAAPYITNMRADLILESRDLFMKKVCYSTTDTNMEECHLTPFYKKLTKSHYSGPLVESLHQPIRFTE